MTDLERRFEELNTTRDRLREARIVLKQQLAANEDEDADLMRQIRELINDTKNAQRTK